jgi:hypothetical protein
MQSHPIRNHNLILVALLAIGLAFAAGCAEDTKLQVNRLSRSSGVSGDIVTFEGAGFQAGGAKDVRVYFDGHKAKVLRIQGNDEIKVEVPGGIELGKTVDIKMIFEPGGEITLEKAFKYVEPARSSVGDLVGEEGKK